MLFNFLADVGDSFIHPHNADGYIVLSGASTAAVKEGMKTENVKLIGNCFKILFWQIEIQKHDHTIDKIDFPSITSTALFNWFCSPNDEKIWKYLAGSRPRTLLQMNVK